MNLQLASSLPRSVVQAQLDRIVGSRQFRNAPRLSRFITFVVAQSLAGQSERLKGYSIGLEVFDKSDDFDPETDTIVRVQARVLRQKLAQYYLEDGANDPVRIVIAKGGYQPEFYLQSGEETPDVSDPIENPSVRLSDKPSIAVLPFECVGLNNDCGFLAHGLTEGVISDLSRFRDLSVFSRSTTKAAKSQQLSIAQMFRRFRPDFVLEGSFRVRNAFIETRIRLIDAATESVLMTDQIDLRMDAVHVYDVLDEVSARIAARIAVEYGPIGHFARRAERSRPAIKWETYAWISRYFEYGFQLDQDARDGIEAGLLHSIVADPTSAEAHAALSMIGIENYRAMSPAVGDLARLDRAMEHALLAVQHDPQSAMAHQSLALAYFHSHRFIDFRASVERALELNPGHADMLATFGLCFARRGNWDESIPLLDRALALNPLHPDWYHVPKAMYLMMTEGSQKAIEEIIARPMPDFFAFHLLLIWFHVELDDMEEASVEMDRLLAIVPDTERLVKDYFHAICLCNEIADRAIAAFRKVGLHIS